MITFPLAAGVSNEEMGNNVLVMDVKDGIWPMGDGRNLEVPLQHCGAGRFDSYR